MLLCNFCAGNKKIATFACENCTYYYCPTCLNKFHPKVGPLKTHNILKASALHCEETFCKKHGEKYCIFCKVCRQLLCVKCVVDHASHPLSNTDEAYNSAKEILKNKHIELEKHLKSSTKMKKEMEQKTKAIKTAGKEAVNKIHVECDFLRSTISACEKTMVHTVTQDEQEKLTYIQNTLDRIPKLSAASMRIVHDLSSALKESSMNLFLSKFGELNVKAENQLMLVSSVKQLEHTNLRFDYENFNCSEVVNALGDKLSVPTDNLHGLGLVTRLQAENYCEDTDCSSLVSSHLHNGKGDNSSPVQQPASICQPNACVCQPPVPADQSPASTCQPPASISKSPASTGQPPESTSKPPTSLCQLPVTACQLPASDHQPPADEHSQSFPPDKDKELSKEQNIKSNVLHKAQSAPRLRPYPQTFLNRVISKHPEFLHHSVSLDAVLRREGREKETALETSHPWYGGESMCTNNNNTVGQQRKVKSQQTNRLERLLFNFSDECSQIGEILEAESASLTESNRYMISRAIPTTTIGATKRAKDSYYSSYTLSSDRLQDEHVQLLINNAETASVIDQSEANKCSNDSEIEKAA